MKKFNERLFCPRCRSEFNSIDIASQECGFCGYPDNIDPMFDDSDDKEDEFYDDEE